jgi:transposase InsO family protein
MYLVIVLDWYTKEIIGHCFGMQSKARDWLKALNEAVNNRDMNPGVKFKY